MGDRRRWNHRVVVLVSSSGRHFWESVFWGAIVVCDDLSRSRGRDGAREREETIKRARERGRALSLSLRLSSLDDREEKSGNLKGDGKFAELIFRKSKTMPKKTAAPPPPQEPAKKKRDFLDDDESDDDDARPVSALEQPKLRVNESFAKRLEVRMKKEEALEVQELARCRMSYGSFGACSRGRLDLFLLRRALGDQFVCIYAI